MRYVCWYQDVQLLGNLAFVSVIHEDNQSQVNATMCTYEGKDYIKGQTIPGPDPCRSCTCVERFNGNVLLSEIQ